MAFGDADNDISMLTSVKYGMAMGNGTENCRKAAPYVTDTNEKDGVAKGILRFLSEAEQTLQAENSDKNVKFV